MPPLQLLYADDFLVVVDKPAGVLVVPAPGRGGPTMVELLSRQLGRRVLAVHRLDEGTTGAIAFALDDPARDSMEGLFRRREVDREYYALVVGRPQPEHGRIESQLREQGGVVVVVSRGGQRAVTNYETVARRGRLTLLRCRLETGRRNQIRAHLQALGHPLAGDRKYGYRPREGEGFGRPMLHAFRLGFRHPILGHRVEVEVAAPELELRP